MSSKDTHIPALGNYDIPQSSTSTKNTPSGIVVPTPPSDLASFLTEVPPNIPLPPHIKLPPGVPFPPLPPPLPSTATPERRHETENTSSSEGERDRHSGGGYHNRNVLDDANSGYNDDRNQQESPSIVSNEKENSRNTTSTSTSRRIGLEEYALSRKRRSENIYHHDHDTHQPPNRRKRSTGDDAEEITNNNDLSGRHHGIFYGENVGDRGDRTHHHQNNRYSSDEHYAKGEDNFSSYQHKQPKNMQASDAASPPVPSRMDVQPVHLPRKNDSSNIGISRSSSFDQHNVGEQHHPNINTQSLSRDDCSNENFNSHHNSKQETSFDNSSTQQPCDARPVPNCEPLPPNRNFNSNERPPHFDRPRQPYPPYNFNNNDKQRPFNQQQQMQQQRPPFRNDGPRTHFDNFNNGPRGFQQQHQPRFQNPNHHGDKNTANEFDSNIPPHDFQSYNRHQDHQRPPRDHNNQYNQHRPHYNNHNQQLRRPPFHDSRRGRGNGAQSRFNHHSRNRGSYRGRGGGHWN